MPDFAGFPEGIPASRDSRFPGYRTLPMPGLCPCPDFAHNRALPIRSEGRGTYPRFRFSQFLQRIDSFHVFKTSRLSPLTGTGVR